MKYKNHVVKADGVEITYEFGGETKSVFVPFQKTGVTATLRPSLHVELIRLLPDDVQKLFKVSN